MTNLIVRLPQKNEPTHIVIDHGGIQAFFSGLSGNVARYGLKLDPNRSAYRQWDLLMRIETF